MITAAHSRFILGRMIPTRTTVDLLLGMWMLLELLGRVPRRLIWDGPPITESAAQLVVHSLHC